MSPARYSLCDSADDKTTTFSPRKLGEGPPTGLPSCSASAALVRLVRGVNFFLLLSALLVAGLELARAILSAIVAPDLPSGGLPVTSSLSFSEASALLELPVPLQLGLPGSPGQAWASSAGGTA